MSLTKDADYLNNTGIGKGVEKIEMAAQVTRKKFNSPRNNCRREILQHKTHELLKKTTYCELRVQICETMKENIGNDLAANAKVSGLGNTYRGDC
jgi:hypothetical protein